jgi:hypothetical protein
LLLLGDQLPPLRQRLLSALIHAPSLPHSALADKMWFRYRSRTSRQPDRNLCSGSPRSKFGSSVSVRLTHLFDALSSVR